MDTPSIHAQRRRYLQLGLGAIAAVTLPQITQLAKATEDFIKGPPVKDIRPTQLSRHVWTIYSPDGFPTVENQGMMANITFVTTQQGVIILDSGASLQIGEMTLRMIRQVSSKPVVAIFNSHYHGDHFLGNQAHVQAFGTLPIYAHEYTKKQIEGIEGSSWRNLMERWTNQATIGTEVVAPNQTVKHGQVFNYGDVHLRIHHNGTAHTPGDICIEVIEDQVTHVGDVAMDHRIANIDDGSYRGTFALYDQLKKNAGKQLWIPCHGEAKRTLLDEYQIFLSGIYEACVKAVNDGLDPSAAKAMVLKDPRVVNYAQKTKGFENNIGKYTSLAYLEAEKEAF